MPHAARQSAQPRLHNATMTLLEHIASAAAQFETATLAFGQGTLTAYDEAAWLLLWAAGLPLDTELDDAEFLQSPANTQPSAALVAKIEGLIAARIEQRRPVAYLTGEAWLQGVPFYVDERCIIPRSLIAEIIADGSADAWLSPNTERVLDLCTGNGSLAVLAAMAWPEVSVLASDISADALAVAQINIDKHQLQTRISLQQGDGVSSLLQSGARFDLILCNPPYVNSDSMQALPAEFKNEPDLALAGGADGMDFVRPLLAALPALLNEDGVLILEIGHERAYFEAAFPQLAPVWLETSMGCEQVLLLTREALLA